VECIVSDDAAKSETLHSVGSKGEASTRNRETTRRLGAAKTGTRPYAIP